MADGPPTEPELDGLEDELDQYVVSESPAREWLMEQLRRAPWWMISFLVHTLVLLILWKWPYRAMADLETYAPIEVELIAEQQIEEIEQEEFEPPDVEEDLEVPIEDIPISPETPTLEEPGPDLDLPPDEEMVKDVERPIPSIDPPSATPVFAVESSQNRLSRGIYSGRTSRGRAAARGGRGGTSANAESAVMAGLKWLAKAQEKDGSWNAKKWEGRAPYEVGMTGLALLCFLGAGYTEQKGPFKTTVARGLAWLKAHQKPDGRFPYQTFYEMGIAAMAVSEAYGLSRNPATGRMAQKALDYIVKVQPDHGGFRYKGSVPKGEGDMSVTGWQIMAIKSGICAELKVPEQAVERSRVFLKNSWREYGRSAYIVSGKGRGGSLAVTSIGMLCRIFLGGEGYDDEIRQTANFLISKEMKGGKPVPGGTSKELVHDLYYTYYACLAMFQTGGEFWANWNTMFRDALVKAQVHKVNEGGKYVRGSWDPKKHKRGAGKAGRVYCTAMAILSLEVYYRFLPVYKR
jgi:hypothetical protein